MLDDGIENEGTKIHCLYATKMGDKYLKRYLKYFKKQNIISSNLQHEELLLCKPNEWTKTIKQCLD